MFSNRGLIRNETNDDQRPQARILSVRRLVNTSNNNEDQSIGEIWPWHVCHVGLNNQNVGPPFAWFG